MTEATPTPTPEPTPTPTPEPTPTPTPEANWRDSLPDDLKGDATLSRFADVEALSRAHIEAHKTAKAKFSLPAEGATETEMAEFYDKIGRPKAAGDYVLPMPELGFEEGTADDVKAAALEAQKELYKPYQDLAHKIGLRPEQASAIVQFEIDREAAHYAKGAEEIAALKKEMGAGYDAALESAQAIFKHLGFPPEFANELDQKVGSAALIKGFMKLAGVAGEPTLRIDGDGDAIFGEDGNAEAALNAKFQDKAWRDKFNAGDTATVAEHARLTAKAKQQAQPRR